MAQRLREAMADGRRPDQASYGEDGQCGYDEISQFDLTVLPEEARAVS